MGVRFLKFFATKLRKGYNVGANVILTVVFFLIILISIFIAPLKEATGCPKKNVEEKSSFFQNRQCLKITFQVLGQVDNLIFEGKSFIAFCLELPVPISHPLCS